ncbi:type II secretion system F family protein [Pseudoduganella sp. R-34]|uniref:type II secretion system F family protein n=1 Tax=Pseudoduganella sp. R-34 TaxID=3404062 RepID=UPI003CF501FF
MLKILKSLYEYVMLYDFRKKRVEFYGDWAKSIKAGEVTKTFLMAELAIANAKQTRDRSRAFALRMMLGRIKSGQVQKMSEVVATAMPVGDLVMLGAADSAKEKEQIKILGDLVKAVEEQSEAMKEIHRAVLPPLLLLPGLGFFAYVLSSKSIPIIEKVAPPEVWTPFNELVRVIANLIGGYGVHFLVLAVVAGMTFAYWLPRWIGKLRLRLERVDPELATWLSPIAPYLLPLSMYRDAQALMLLSALAVLLESGKRLNEALELIQSRSTPYLRYHVTRILDYIEIYPLEASVAFTNGILSPRVSARLATISRNNPSFEEVLIEIGTVGAKEIRQQVSKSAFKLNLVFISLAASLTVFLYLGQLSITRSMDKELDPTTIMQRKLEQQERSH